MVPSSLDSALTFSAVSNYKQNGNNSKAFMWFRDKKNNFANTLDFFVMQDYNCD